MRDLSEIVRSADAVELLRHELTARSRRLCSTSASPRTTPAGCRSTSSPHPPRRALRDPAAEVVDRHDDRAAALRSAVAADRSSSTSASPFARRSSGCSRRSPARRVCRSSAAPRRAWLVGSDRGGADRQQPALQRAEVRSGTFDSPASCGRRPPASSIAVRDQGVGISAADRMRIFERHAHAPSEQGGGRASASGWYAS